MKTLKRLCFAPVETSTCSGAIDIAWTRRELGRDRGAQGEDAADVGVLADAALVERGAGGVLDVRRRVEVGLAGAEADDVDAVGLQLAPPSR